MLFLILLKWNCVEIRIEEAVRKLSNSLFYVLRMTLSFSIVVKLEMVVNWLCGIWREINFELNTKLSNSITFKIDLAGSEPPLRFVAKGRGSTGASSCFSSSCERGCILLCCSNACLKQHIQRLTPIGASVLVGKSVLNTIWDPKRKGIIHGIRNSKIEFFYPFSPIVTSCHFGRIPPKKLRNRLIPIRLILSIRLRGNELCLESLYRPACPRRSYAK